MRITVAVVMTLVVGALLTWWMLDQAKAQTVGGEAEARPALFLGNESLPPMNFMKNGKPTGIVIDLAEAIAKRMHHPIEIRLMNWAEAQQLVLEGQANALLQIDPNLERLKIYDFSEPLLTSEFTIFTSTERLGVSSMRDLQGLKVGVEEMGLPVLSMRENPQIIVEIIPDLIQGFRMLASGTVDAVVSDRWVGSFVLAEYKIRGVKLIEEPVVRSHSAIAVKKGNTDLLGDINAGLADIRRDGTYDRIIKSWRSKEVVFKTREQLRQQEWLIATISLALIAALVGVTTLIKEIRKRKKSEEKLSLLINYAPASMAMFDRQMRYLHVSRRWCSDYNLGDRDLTGLSHYEVFPDIPESWKKVHRRALAGEVLMTDIDRFERADGSIQWLRWEARPWHDQAGNIGGIVIFTEDISESKNAMESLRLSEERFRKLFEQHSAVKLVIDPDTGNINDANQAAAKFYGWPLEKLKRMSIQQINVLTPEDEKAASTGSGKFEFRHRLADESIREVEVFNNNIEIAGKDLLFSIVQDITERKRAEDMLRLHMAIMETAAEGIFLIGLEDNIIKWTNSKFEQLFGYGPGEMIGMHVDKVNAPTEKTPTETRISIVDMLRQAGEWHGEIKSIKKNGTHFWCYIHISLFNHPEFGTVMVSAHTDITDRKQAEAALQESELRFRTMANAIPQMAWIARADGYIFWYNQRWYDYTGMVPEKMEGWGWQNVHDPKVLPKVLKRWQVSLATSEPFDMTFPLRGADGVFHPFLTRVIPLKDNAGRIMQWFGTNTDVSELKRIEQSLRESEALYRSIGESIDYGVWICAPDGRNTYASESFLKMAGITQEQCSNFGWGNLLHPDDAERTITAWQECVRTGGIWDIEHRFRGADGQWHYVLARGVPVRNQHGKIINWAGINLDINRIKQAEEQIRASLAEKEVLLKEVHHRVKNNMQVISSLISLQADSLADEKLQGVLGDVRDRVRTMALVHEKLYQTEDLARIDFADYATSLLNYLWSAHTVSMLNIRLNMSLIQLILSVEMAMNFGLILNELVSNAIKHAFPGGSVGEVTVTLEHDTVTGAVCLRVRDNGVGLPVDLDWRQSSTLGLRLVQMLAKQMRGTVQAGSGPGTEFHININVKEICLG